MRNWFIGDGVIVRYGDNGNARVRVNPDHPGPLGRRSASERVFRVALVNDDGKALKIKEFHSLIDALERGEEWLP